MLRYGTQERVKEIPEEHNAQQTVAARERKNSNKLEDTKGYLRRDGEKVLKRDDIYK